MSTAPPLINRAEGVRRAMSTAPLRLQAPKQSGAMITPLAISYPLETKPGKQSVSSTEAVIEVVSLPDPFAATTSRPATMHTSDLAIGESEDSSSVEPKRRCASPSPEANEASQANPGAKQSSSSSSGDEEEEEKTKNKGSVAFGKLPRRRGKLAQQDRAKLRKGKWTVSSTCCYSQSSKAIVSHPS
jgi:hypothetical protein